MTISPRAATLWRHAWTPLSVGRLRLPAPALVVLAAIGAIFLFGVATGTRTSLGDEHAYWLAGQRVLHGEPLYNLSVNPGEPYAYWYPPPFAQVLAPITAIIPSEAFTVLWTALLLGCLWLLALRNVLVALAFVAFVPVAAELWVLNIHLVLAVLIVLAVRRWPTLFAIGALIKIAPGLGIVYLAAQGRWRAATVAAIVGILIVGGSVILDPKDWGDFAALALGRGTTEMASLIPIPYALRFAIGLALAAIAGRVVPRVGEPLLVVAIVAASPTLWGTAFAMLVAIVPLVTLRRREERRLTEATVDEVPPALDAFPAYSVTR
jgi:hypothetical protein